MLALILAVIVITALLLGRAIARFFNV